MGALDGDAIAGIEAMAGGEPVIPTRCGGPEEYVVDHVNGCLSGHDAAEIAARVVELSHDRLAAGARRSAEESYAHEAFDRTLQRICRSVWNEPL